MVEYWFPYAGHPDGESQTAWFRVENGAGYRTADNPAGESDEPCFLVVDGSAYPSVSLPGEAPTFEIIGSFAYAPLGTAWFHIVRAVH
jgi:hypothetical protein